MLPTRLRGPLMENLGAGFFDLFDVAPVATSSTAKVRSGRCRNGSVSEARRARGRRPGSG
jgi:hypothetical protein